MSLQIPVSARTGVRQVPEHPGLDLAVGLPVTFLPHVDGSLVQPAVDRPVLGPLPVTQSDGEPPEVPVDDLDAVVRRAGDVEHVGAAGDHLALQTKSTAGVVNDNIYHDTVSQEPTIYGRNSAFLMSGHNLIPTFLDTELTQVWIFFLPIDVKEYQW